MMRRLLVVLLVVMVGVRVFAQQQSQLLYDLTETFTVQDLGFTFNYPQGWLFTVGDGGIYFAPDEKSLALAADGDLSTMPSTVYFSITGLPLSLITEEQDPALDDVVASLVTLAQIQEVERIEFGVLGRRAVLVVTTAPVLSYTTIWRQDDIITALSFVAPDEQTLLAHGYTLGYMLGTIQGVNAQPLPNRYDWQDVGLSIAYPEGWQVYPERYAIAQFEEDAAGIVNPSYQPKGYVIGMLFLTLSVTPEEAAAFDYRIVADNVFSLFQDAASYTYEELRSQETRAFGMHVAFKDGRQTFVAGFVDAEMPALRLFTLGMPSEKDVEPIRDTWYAMVQNVRILTAKAR